MGISACDGENGCATDSQQCSNLFPNSKSLTASRTDRRLAGWLALHVYPGTYLGDGPAPESPMALPNLNRIRRINATRHPCEKTTLFLGSRWQGSAFCSFPVCI